MKLGNPSGTSRSARESADRAGRSVSVDRIVFFSDAVFAIAITLLAIDLRVPAGLTDGQLAEALRAMIPDIYGFVLSFLVIGMTWVGHHRKFRYIVDWNQRLLLLNLALLLLVAFVPFPSSLLGEYGTTPTGAALYSGTILVLGLISSTLWQASRIDGLIDPSVEAKTVRIESVTAWMVPVLFAAAFGLSFVAPLAAQAIWWSTFLILPLTRRLMVAGGRARSIELDR
jgi:uncharacterized membrane protein